jgi:hypothetical protein
MQSEVARDALLATYGGLSLELCALIYHLSRPSSCASRVHCGVLPESWGL